MHFSKFALLFTSLVLATQSALAVPVARPHDVAPSDSLHSRSDHALVYSRALTDEQRAKAAKSTMLKQADRKAKKEFGKKKRIEGAKKDQQRRIATPKPPGGKRPKLDADKAAHRLKRLNPIRAARKEKKTAEHAKATANKAATKAVAAKRKTDARAERRKTGAPAPPPAVKKPKPSAADKAQVKSHLQHSAKNMQNMKNIPGRKDKFVLGSTSANGRDVRQGIMNAFVHKDTKVGPGQPKKFENRPYTAGPDAGKNVFPGAPSGPMSGLSEYPIIPGGAGYQGAKPGTTRAVADLKNGQFHGVMTHKAGHGDDHFKMNKV